MSNEKQKAPSKAEKQKFLDAFDRLTTKLETKIDVALNILKPTNTSDHETKSTS